MDNSTNAYNTKLKNNINSSHEHALTPCYYEQQGSNNNSPIVFIHGSYASTSTWKKIVQQLALTHHCISIKLPGHCGMPDPDDFNAPNISTELDIIESVIAELTNQPIHLIGHSFGGVVALALALKGSVNITQLTLFEPVSTWVFKSVGDLDMTAQVNTFIQDYRESISNNEVYACGQVIDFWGGKGSFEPLPDFIKDGMKPLTNNNNRHWSLCENTYHHRSALNALTIPTKLICGSASNPIAQKIVQYLSHELSNAKQYSITGASHFLVTSHANQCIDIIND
ncbi:alpha/beta hydrolase [Moritella marina ATCC 15381]|uniref:Alpha/beta hydrolase n=1 Tax=Moritella marina ATCC 15381 TaxID=1202962 RepID=A0A5J6WGI9_MORMI|nr:alpha/beta hydrolase [Moritella marina]QFI37077.1 alpha/beta hydrolase [Moritella marina ATCC 15381]